MGLEEHEAEAQHARARSPAVDERAALRTLERRIPENREAVGMLARASTANSLECGSQEAGG